jgi:hypothetical protein
VRGQLPLFVGGDLPDESARTVREHLRRCASCRLLASDQLQAVRALHRAGECVPAGVDDAFFDELHHGVMAAVATAAAGAPSAVDAAVRPRRVGMIAAAAVLFGLGFAVGGALGGPAGLRHRAPVVVERGNGVVVDPGQPGNVLPMELLGGDEPDSPGHLRTLEQEFLQSNVPGVLPARVETRRSPVPEEGKPGKGNPAAGRADAGAPDAGKPDAGKPDAAMPSTDKPGAGKHR